MLPMTQILLLIASGCLGIKVGMGAEWEVVD